MQSDSLDVQHRLHGADSLYRGSPSHSRRVEGMDRTKQVLDTLQLWERNPRGIHVLG